MTIEPKVETLPTRLGQAMRHVEPHAKLSLSDIILGGQDGLVNVLGVVLGVAAASSDPRIVVAAPPQADRTTEATISSDITANSLRLCNILSHP